jgi:His-Xaa-Ser system protein HxsD
MLVSGTVEFDSATQGIDALRAAAYRLIGVATCEISQAEGRFVCQLTATTKPPKQRFEDAEALRAEFLNLVTDENLRECIAARTEGARNVILSLAFGSLANQSGDRR